MLCPYCEVDYSQKVCEIHLTRCPSRLPEVVEDKQLEDMTVKDMQDFAVEIGLVIPPSVRKKDDIYDYIADRISSEMTLLIEDPNGEKIAEVTAVVVENDESPE